MRGGGLLAVIIVLFAVSLAPAASANHLDLSREPTGTWVKEPGVRLEIGPEDPAGTIGIHTPYVHRFPDGTYRMFYDPYGTTFMKSAISSDGLTWTKEPGLRLTGAGHAHILPLGPNLFRMYYEDVAGGQLNGIGSATSSDGISWTVDPGLRLGGSYADPVVFEMGGGILRMYVRLGLNLLSATSTNGLTWSVEPGIRVTDAREFAGVRFPDETIVLYYGQGTPAFAAVLVARSTDGLLFTKDATPALLRGPPGSQDGGGVLTISIVEFPDGTIRMYYQGAPGGDMNFDSRAFSAVAEVAATGACPLSQGFWKNHPAAWPVSSLELGDETYSASDAHALLRTPPKGDASLVLLHQLIAAKLNIANGSDDVPVETAIQDADAALGGFGAKAPYAVKASSTAGQVMISLAESLDEYNNGMMTPACEGASEDSTPLPPTAGEGHAVDVASGVSVLVVLALATRRLRPTV
ncbi:MAG TPA: hypothetical protein VGR51_00730 [Thermoplasmata archaeon]|nr:hypothetical protein [Thermoplasmata archaeon]